MPPPEGCAISPRLDGPAGFPEHASFRSVVVLEAGAEEAMKRSVRWVRGQGVMCVNGEWWRVVMCGK